MWDDDEDEDPTTLTKVLCHNEGFIVASGNGQGFINSYQITTDFEVRIIESYLCQNQGKDPLYISCMNQSYDKNYIVFAAVFEDIVFNQQLNEERMLQPNYLP